MPRFRKICGSTSLLRMVERDGNKIQERIQVEPGDVIECEKHELRNFAHQFESLDPPEEEKPPVVEANLEVIQRRSESGRLVAWYDVVNTQTGDPINTRALKKADAEELVR